MSDENIRLLQDYTNTIGIELSEEDFIEMYEILESETISSGNRLPAAFFENDPLLKTFLRVEIEAV